MTDLEWAERFLGRFALPLVHGAAVQVGVPLARRGAERLLAAISAGLDGTATAEALAEARQRRLLELVPVVGAPRLFEDRSAALLLIALHDLLFLHHPAAARLSERQAELLHGFTRQLIARAAAQLPRVATRLPETSGEARLPTGAAEPRRLALAAQRLLGRHSLLGGLFRLWRADTRAPTLWGERDYRGVAPPPQRLRALLGRAQLALPERRHVRLLPELLARRDSALAVQALLGASPLTALLPPVGVGLLPELAGQAAWLRLPTVARLVVARYLKANVQALVAYARDHATTFVAAERALLGTDHAAVGGAMARHWHFPSAIAVAIAAHHTPEAEPPSLVLDAVVVANVVAKSIGAGRGAEGTNFAADPAAFDRLGLDFPAFGRVCLATEAALRDLAAVRATASGPQRYPRPVDVHDRKDRGTP
jgi:hypothetical protein